MFVPVPPATLDCMARGKPFALFIEDDASEGARYRCIGLVPLPSVVGLQHLLHFLPDLRVDDRLVLAITQDSLVRYSAHVDGVGQNAVVVATTEKAARGPGSGAAGDAHGICSVLDGPDRAKLKVLLVNRPDILASFSSMTSSRFSTRSPREHSLPSTCPSSWRLRSCPDALTCDLALELGEREQDIERQPTHRGRSVELLDDRDEGYSTGIEDLDDLGEVEEGSGEPVDLVDDYIHLLLPI